MEEKGDHVAGQEGLGLQAGQSRSSPCPGVSVPQSPCFPLGLLHHPTVLSCPKHEEGREGQVYMFQ